MFFSFNMVCSSCQGRGKKRKRKRGKSCWEEACYAYFAQLGRNERLSRACKSTRFRSPAGVKKGEEKDWKEPIGFQKASDPERIPTGSIPVLQRKKKGIQRRRPVCILARLRANPSCPKAFAECPAAIGGPTGGGGEEEREEWAYPIKFIFLH